MANFNATDTKQEFHFTLGVVVHQLVAGDAVLVEAPGLVAGLEHDHIMPVHGQAVGARQPGGAGTNYGDALASGRRALERVLGEVGVVQGIALQLADQHRCAFLRVVAYAGLLAKDFGGADAGATAAEDVGRENALGGALQVFVADAVDERRDVDLARAGVDAGSVIAIQAACAFDGGLASGEGWGQVAEALGQLVGTGPGARQVVQSVDHGCSLFLVFGLEWGRFASQSPASQLPQVQCCP